MSFIKLYMLQGYKIYSLKVAYIYKIDWTSGILYLLKMHLATFLKPKLLRGLSFIGAFFAAI